MGACFRSLASRCEAFVAACEEGEEQGIAAVSSNQAFGTDFLAAIKDDGDVLTGISLCSLRARSSSRVGKSMPSVAMRWLVEELGDTDSARLFSRCKHIS